MQGYPRERGDEKPPNIAFGGTPPHKGVVADPQDRRSIPAVRLYTDDAYGGSQPFPWKPQDLDHDGKLGARQPRSPGPPAGP